MRLTVRIELYIKGRPYFYDLTLNEYMRVIDLEVAGIGKPDPLPVVQAAIDHGLMSDSDGQEYSAWSSDERDAQQLRRNFARRHLRVLFDDPNRVTKRLYEGAELKLIVEGYLIKVLAYTFVVKSSVHASVHSPWGGLFAQREVILIDMSLPATTEAALST